jgi:hypothetical protein
MADHLTAPPLTSRHTRLRPPNPAFVQELYELAATGQLPWSWRSATETPETFRQSLWSGVLTQFAIEDRRTGQSAGLLTAYGANIAHGYAYVSMLLHPDYRMRVWPLEGAVLFGNYLFVRFNLRNLYAETAAPYLDQFKSGIGRLFEIEAGFKGRLIINSEKQDLYILTFTRDRWRQSGEEALERCLPPGRSTGARLISSPHPSR